MIKRVPIFLLLLLAIPASAQNKKPTTLREVLLAELQSTHGAEEWFVPANIAVKREKPEKFSGNNDETFDQFDTKRWNETVQQLDDVMKELEKWVETADEAKLKDSAQVLTHISTHNAYHIGQIIYVRKEQGSWDPKNGVQ